VKVTDDLTFMSDGSTRRKVGKELTFNSDGSTDIEIADGVTLNNVTGRMSFEVGDGIRTHSDGSVDFTF